MLNVHTTPAWLWIKAISRWPSKNWRIVLLLIASYACQQAAPANRSNGAYPRDRSIGSRNSSSDMFMDSVQVEQFIARTKPDAKTAASLREFYASRNYQYAWFADNGLSEPGLAFSSLLGTFIHFSKDSALFDTTLIAKLQSFPDDTALSANDPSLAQTDIGLTRQFFIYAKAAYAGRLNPADMQWFIPRKKVDVLALLDSLMVFSASSRSGWQPFNFYYRAMKTKLMQYDSISENGGWKRIPGIGKKSIKPGDSDPAIAKIKVRLSVTGDFPNGDTTHTYGPDLVPAIKRAEHSFGQSEDGIIDQALIDALNVPSKSRLQQMLINLERMRWLPDSIPPYKIVANIPEFMIHVMDTPKKLLDMRIVVGKAGHNTVIFSNQLQYIVFSPYWNVPPSIVKNEILPAMKKNRNYLTKNRMEITGYANGLPVIRQKPGGDNSLGRVKFLFPNTYNIYFHDTPAKSLFSREKRAFSHGCIRLANAEKMAECLLRNQPEWTTGKIDEAMHLQKEKWVTLPRRVPVYIVYFTSWVDDKGILNFRNDVYGHDTAMAKLMFGEASR